MEGGQIGDQIGDQIGGQIGDQTETHPSVYRVNIQDDLSFLKQDLKPPAKEQNIRHHKERSEWAELLASPDLTAMQKAVQLAIIEHPRISRKGLAQQFEAHASAIQKHIEALKTKKAIIRVGGTRGYWKINNRTKK